MLLIEVCALGMDGQVNFIAKMLFHFLLKTELIDHKGNDFLRLKSSASIALTKNNYIQLLYAEGLHHSLRPSFMPQGMKTVDIS